MINKANGEDDAKPVTQEESDLFRKAVQGVTPMVAHKRASPTRKKKKKIIN